MKLAIRYQDSVASVACHISSYKQIDRYSAIVDAGPMWYRYLPLSSIGKVDIASRTIAMGKIETKIDANLVPLLLSLVWGCGVGSVQGGVDNTRWYRFGGGD